MNRHFLQIESLAKRFPQPGAGEDVTVFDQVSFRMEKGNSSASSGIPAAASRPSSTCWPGWTRPVRAA
jgi:hypothetical protein